MDIREHGRKTMNSVKDIMSSVSVDEDKLNTKRKRNQNNTTSSSSSGTTSEIIENVLILQGGGSLGAFGCGVFKELSQKNMKID
jgi:predicted acylesterase/phospholipase RssA